MTRRIIRKWHNRGATVTTIHTPYGQITRGTIRLHHGAWHILDYDGFAHGPVAGDYLDAEQALLDATTELD